MHHTDCPIGPAAGSPARRNGLPFALRFAGTLAYPLGRPAACCAWASDAAGFATPDMPDGAFVLHVRQGVDQTVWDASVVLAKYMESFPAGFWRGKHVLELGAGCGLSGLVAACLGAQVELTDLGDMMPLLRANVAANRDVVAAASADALASAAEQRSGSAVATELLWGSTDRPETREPDFLIGADIVYEVQHFDCLVRSLTDLASHESTILLAVEHRWRDVEKWFVEEISPVFCVSEIPQESMPPFQGAPNIGIYQLRKKR